MVRLIEKMTRDYLEDVFVRLAHHFSAIEGNTITLPETVTLILNNTLPNNANGLLSSRLYKRLIRLVSLNHATDGSKLRTSGSI